MRGLRQWKEIAGLVWPASLSALLFTLLEVADAAMLGAAGVQAMAGALLGSTIVYLVLVLPLQTLRAFTPLAAQRAAAGLPLRGLRDLLLLASLALGLLALGAVLLVAGLLPRLGYEPELLRAARTFILWRAPFLPVELAFVGAWATLEGLRGTREPLAGGLTAIGVNLALNVVLIPGRLGLPALGVAGAALATDLATLAGLAVLLRRLQSALPPAPRLRLVDPQLLRPFLRIGWPLGVASFLESGGWLLLGLLIARAGAQVAAVHGVLAQLLALGLALAQGVAAAGAVSVARATGRRDPVSARRAATQVLRGQLVLGGLLAGLAMLAGREWVRLFTADAAVGAASEPLLPLLGGMLLAEGLGLVLCGVIEGSGRTRILVHATLIFEVGFVLLALLHLGPDATVSSLYQAWLLKSVLKLLLLAGWLERSRWRQLLGRLARCPRLPIPSASRCGPGGIVGTRIDEASFAGWSALPEPDT